jgi:hypothetical protein
MEAVIQRPEQSPNKELQPNRVTTGTILLKFMLFLNCSYNRVNGAVQAAEATKQIGLVQIKEDVNNINSHK